VIAIGTSGPAARAAKAATATIPIVFGVGGDPVQLGLVVSLARPGGNATGVNFLVEEVVTKRLRLLHDLVPQAVRLAVLVNPANASATENTLRDATRKPNRWHHHRLLRTRRNWPRCCTADQRNKIAPSHELSSNDAHSLPHQRMRKSTVCSTAKSGGRGPVRVKNSALP
jgi:hypothetical protein